MAIVRVVDLETTGLDAAEHGVVEAAWWDVYATGYQEGGPPFRWRVADGGTEAYVNPGRPIPPEASAVHHIIDEDVANARAWANTLPLIYDPVDRDEVVAFCAHNAKFDRQWFPDEAVGNRPWICTYKCALRLWPDAPGHSNQVLRYWRKPQGLDRAVAEQAHSAYPDAYVTAHLLRDMLNADHTVEQLVEWSSQPVLLTTVSFGKHRGARWSEVDSSYLEWVLRQDFDEDVLFTVRHEMERRKKEMPL